MRRGFALLIVLWTLVPVSVLFLTLSGVARSDSQLTSNLRSAARLQAAADGGVATAIFTLLGAPDAVAPLSLKIGDATVSVEITDLGGRVNPNTADVGLLRALLQRGGANPAQATRIAIAIVDWRSPAQTPQEIAAKVAVYRAAGMDHGPPAAPFESLDELREVIGMTPVLFDALRPSLTLFTDREPNLALAPGLVRAALGDLGVTAATTGSDHVFRIAAHASAADGSGAVRVGTVRVSPAPNGRSWKVLNWETDGG